MFGRGVLVDFLEHPENLLAAFEQGRAPRYGHVLVVKAREWQDLAAVLGEAFDGITSAARDAGRDWQVAFGAGGENVACAC